MICGSRIGVFKRTYELPELEAEAVVCFYYNLDALPDHNGDRTVHSTEPVVVFKREFDGEDPNEEWRLRQKARDRVPYKSPQKMKVPATVATVEDICGVGVKYRDIHDWWFQSVWVHMLEDLSKVP